MSTFKEKLQLSFKSEDTEEWLDVHFTRPIGLVFALLWNKLGIHPNVITIISIFLGAGAGWMFHYSDLTSNLCGVGLLMLANFCDSTDGQMARLTGKKTLIGRMLDGFSGDVWFFCIYLAIVYRLWDRNIPGTEWQWGIWGFFFCAFAGFIIHSPQSTLADYYRQIHLFFLLGKEGSELDNYKQQRAIYENLPKGEILSRVFYYNYANYCKNQEKQTPHFQRFFALWNSSQSLPDSKLESIRQQLLTGSRPLMKYTNLLTFNTRAITIYVACVCDIPWLYPLMDLTVFQAMYMYMHHKHETLCRKLASELSSTPTP